MTKTKKTPAIIFDFGGVLADWNPYYLYRKVIKDDAQIKAFLEEVNFKYWNLRFDGGYPFAEGINEMCAEHPQQADLIRRFHTHWVDSLGEVLTDTVEVVRRLHAAGYPLYGLSNWSTETFNQIKDRFVFLEYLEDYVLSGQVKIVKPSPEIFTILLERIGLPAAECLFIDDSAVNIQAAADLGIQTILFQSAGQLSADLAKRNILF